MSDQVAQEGATRSVARDVAEALEAYQRAVLEAREAWSTADPQHVFPTPNCADAEEARAEAGRRLLTLLARLAVEGERG